MPELPPEQVTPFVFSDPSGKRWPRLRLMLLIGSVLFFVALAIAVILDRRARKHQEIEILKRVYAGFIPLPWLLAAAIVLNGRLDSAKNVRYVPAQVQGKFLMKGLVRGSRRLVVHSWRPDQKFERLAVDSDDFDRFAVGDRIEVAVEPGVLGIPWVYGVYREGRPRE